MTIKSKRGCMRISFLLMLAFFSSTSWSKTIYDCEPTTVNIFDNLGIDMKSQEKNLSKKDASENKVQITLENGKYFWKTRGNLELFKNKSGEFETYHETKGQGYFKVVNIKGKMVYIEHVHIKLATITYIGFCK